MISKPCDAEGSGRSSSGIFMRSNKPSACKFTVYKPATAQIQPIDSKYGSHS